jgi:predicted transcriptional regulator
MKTATLPSLRVEPELRDAAEQVLEHGETLSSFIEASVRETIERRQARAEFIARGLAARDDARSTGQYVGADVVHKELAAKLAAARERLSGSGVAPVQAAKEKPAPARTAKARG